MSRHDRDAVVARALRRLPVPDHGPGFWTALDARLDAEDAARGAFVDEEPPPLVRDDRVDTSELPSVAVLRPPAPAPAHHRNRFLAVAAAVAVVALAAGIVVRGDDGGDRRDDLAELADEPDNAATTLAQAFDAPVESAASSTAPGPESAAAPAGPTTTAGPYGGRPAPTATAAVVDYTKALELGDLGMARALLGPRSLRYLGAADIDVDRYLITSGERFGTWGGSEPTIYEVEVPGVGAVVVLVGSRTAEGVDGYRVDAFPAVEQDGGWVVEPVAWSPVDGGQVTVVSPAPGPDGWSGLPPDGELVAQAAGAPQYWFSIDQRAAVAEDDGTHDPPGDLAVGTHVAVVAAVDADVFTAVAGTFVVEG